MSINAFSDFLSWVKEACILSREVLFSLFLYWDVVHVKYPDTNLWLRILEGSFYCGNLI